MYMRIYKALICVVGLAGLFACSGDKVLPEGNRLSVLTPVSSIKPDVVNGGNRIKVSEKKDIFSWEQAELNSQHLIPNINIDDMDSLIWKADFGQGTSKRDKLMAKPLIVKGSVFVLDAETVLSSYKLADGKLQWTLKLEAKNKNVQDTSLKGIGVVYGQGNIYVATGYGDVYSVNSSDGKINWQKSLEVPIRIAPMFANKYLYIQSADNKLLALNVQTGDDIWKYDISAENTALMGGAGLSFSPDLNLLLAGFPSGDLQVFNATLGTPLWNDVLVSNRQAYSSTFLNSIKASPVIVGDVVYAMGNSNVLTAIDIRSGLRIWEKEIGGSNTPLVNGNTVYVVSNSNELVALDKNNGSILWATPIDLGKNSADISVYQPLMINGRVMVTLSNGEIQYFMPQTGKIIEKKNMGMNLNFAPVFADGYSVFISPKAEIYVYK